MSTKLAAPIALLAAIIGATVGPIGALGCLALAMLVLPRGEA